MLFPLRSLCGSSHPDLMFYSTSLWVFCHAMSGLTGAHPRCSHHYKDQQDFQQDSTLSLFLLLSVCSITLMI